MTEQIHLAVMCPDPTLVLEPDPRKIEQECLVNEIGCKCTLRLVCMQTHFQLAFDYHSDGHLLEMLTIRELSLCLIQPCEPCSYLVQTL